MDCFLREEFCLNILSVIKWLNFKISALLYYFLAWVKSLTLFISYCIIAFRLLLLL